MADEGIFCVPGCEASILLSCQLSSNHSIHSIQTHLSNRFLNEIWPIYKAYIEGKQAA